ncbi:MAG: DsrE family protein [Pseudomonadota bacterium]|nr:DsrE family protein [Pseudomonadota bacterium]
MKHTVLSTLAAVALSGCAAMSQDSMHAGTSSKEMKIAFDITDANPQALMTKLTVIDLTRKQLIESGVTPRMVLAFRGDASYYTQTNLNLVKEADRADALKIAAQLRALRKASGVEALEQCNVPLAARKLKPADVMQEVTLVPNGWISLVAYQQKGYGYIAP